MDRHSVAESEWETLGLTENLPRCKVSVSEPAQGINGLG